jgi:aryl-alcohol dehydrogenase-like predicted oxidoreductase
MQYVRYGNTGMVVSKLCLGAMDFPNRLSEEESIRLIHHALDQGITFIDTADSYRRSEEVVGKALEGKRDQVVLTTKVYRSEGGFSSRQGLMRALEASLQRLRTDWVDLYQLHHPDPKTPVEETIATLDTLVQQGKIRYWGVSNHYAWQMAHMLGVSAAHGWEPLVSIQCRYNILDRPIEMETVPFCQRFNIAMITYGPLCGGFLSGTYKRGQEPPEGSRVARAYRRMMTDELFDTLEALEPIAAKYQIGLNQLAVLWVLSKPYVTCPILGGSRPEHFEPMYGLTEMKLDEEDVKRIDEISARYIYKAFENQPIKQGAPPAMNRW